MSPFSTLEPPEDHAAFVRFLRAQGSLPPLFPKPLFNPALIQRLREVALLDQEEGESREIAGDGS